jgi:hypothetical protein
MVLKQKVQSLTRDDNLVKKWCQIKINKSLSLKEKDKTLVGKNTNIEKEKKSNCLSAKIQNISPEHVDENKKEDQAECPNSELNLLLQKKTKLNFQGSIR